jgi:hypothetical protein
VIFLATPQWFIAMDQLRATAVAEADAVRWIPEWGRERMTGMFTTRPDWCISRQRAWGVPIPAFYCVGCNQESLEAVVLLDPKVINHVADIFEKESADAWYKATIPGTVLTTLVNNNIYPEPLYGENNRPNKMVSDYFRLNCIQIYNMSVLNGQSVRRKQSSNFATVLYGLGIVISGQNCSGRETNTSAARSQ